MPVTESPEPPRMLLIPKNTAELTDVWLHAPNLYSIAIMIKATTAPGAGIYLALNEDRVVFIDKQRFPLPTSLDPYTQQLIFMAAFPSVTRVVWSVREFIGDLIKLYPSVIAIPFDFFDVSCVYNLMRPHSAKTNLSEVAQALKIKCDLKIMNTDPAYQACILRYCAHRCLAKDNTTTQTVAVKEIIKEHEVKEINQSPMSLTRQSPSDTSLSRQPSHRDLIPHILRILNDSKISSMQAVHVLASLKQQGLYPRTVHRTGPIVQVLHKMLSRRLLLKTFLASLSTSAVLYP